MDTILKGVRQIKEKYLRMDILTKRTYYACKDNFVVLSSIKSWSQHVFDNNLKSSVPEELNEKVFDTDDEINSKVSLWQGDITKLEVDAIVNAANSKLLGGGGVDGCIHRAAGTELYNECATLNGCEPGSAKITGGYKLPAKYVIHAVGPIGEKPLIVKSAYETCLNIMVENRIRSVAFPCISTGVYGYPSEEAVHVAALSVRKFLENHKTEVRKIINFRTQTDEQQPLWQADRAKQVDRIIFTVFLDKDKEIYERELHNYFPTKSSNSAEPSKL